MPISGQVNASQPSRSGFSKNGGGTADHGAAFAAGVVGAAAAFAAGESEPLGHAIAPAVVGAAPSGGEEGSGYA